MSSNLMKKSIEMFTNMDEEMITDMIMSCNMAKSREQVLQ